MKLESLRKYNKMFECGNHHATKTELKLLLPDSGVGTPV